MSISRRSLIAGLASSALPATAFAQQQRRQAGQARRLSQALGLFQIPFDIYVIGSVLHQVRAGLLETRANYLQKAVISRSLGNNLQFIDLFKWELVNPRTFRGPDWKRPETTNSPGETYYRFFGGLALSAALD